MIELRRFRPQIDIGQPVAIYSTLPIAAVVATCQVREVEVGTPSVIKRRNLQRAAISSDEFDKYYAASDRAVAIHLNNVTELQNPISLLDLRSRQQGYNPPQSWQYFDRTQLHDLLGHHVAHDELMTLFG